MAKFFVDKKRSFFIKYINDKFWKDNVVLNSEKVIIRTQLKDVETDNINLNNQNVYYSNDSDGNGKLSIDQNNNVFVEQNLE